jgi:PleD family two-component response regulator
MDRVRTNLLLGSIAGSATAVTVSFGVAESGDAVTFEEVVERADLALRAAKAGGRDRVVRFEPTMTGAPAARTDVPGA